MKNVLMISYYFPPWGGAGVQRNLKFAKYLPQFGWHSVVITCDQDDATVKDFSLLSEISKDTEIFRVHAANPRSLAFVRKTIKSSRQNRQMSGLPDKSLKTRILELARNLLFVPDEEIFWLLPCALKAASIINNREIDIVFTTSKPYTSHLVGLILRVFFKKPWVADFRDLWVGNPMNKTRKMERFMEWLVIRNATKVITNTENMKKAFVERYRQQYRDKFVTITNGYDEEDFKDISMKDKKDKFSICYIGGFYTNLEINCKYSLLPFSFLEALKELMEEERDLRANLEVCFVGQEDEIVQKSIEDLGLSEVVKMTGYVEHAKATEYLLDSDVSLLIMYDDSKFKAAVPQKAYEYLRAGKPILLLSEENAVSQIVSKYNFGRIVHPLNIIQIKQAIREMYGQWLANDLRIWNDVDQIQKYERKTLTRELAEIMDLLVAR